MTVCLKIVVADDDQDTREFLQEYMARLGHDVRAARDGRQLVELCREFGPDLVVSDYAMPGLNGLEAAAEINRARRVPVVLLSGRHEAEALAVTESAVIAFLTKPVKDQDLRAAVESAATGAAPVRETG